MLYWAIQVVKWLSQRCIHKQAHTTESGRKAVKTVFAMQHQAAIPPFLFPRAFCLLAVTATVLKSSTDATAASRLPLPLLDCTKASAELDGSPAAEDASLRAEGVLETALLLPDVVTVTGSL